MVFACIDRAIIFFEAFVCATGRVVCPYFGPAPFVPHFPNMKQETTRRITRTNGPLMAFRTLKSPPSPVGLRVIYAGRPPPPRTTLQLALEIKGGAFYNGRGSVYGQGGVLNYYDNTAVRT